MNHYKFIMMAWVIAITSSLYSHPVGKLKGKVTSHDDSRGIPGVNVIVKGTVFGTTTGLHGEYEINGIPAGEQTIIISYMGYESREETVTIRSDQVYELNVVLVPGSISLSSLQVEARKPFSAASSVSIRDFDLLVRPVNSGQQMLQLIPGLFIAQHNGGGKAEQIFLRGFDADHGTDVGIYVDGIPVNMATHAHGQGYADLHFVIPETIEGINVYKGPYFARFGDFGTAGSVTLNTTDHPDKNLVKLEGGMFNTGKLTTILKIPTKGEHQSAYLAGQYYTTDGPFEEPLDLNRVNVFGKFHTHISETSEIGVSMGAFSSAWNASGQIPTRAVDNSLISRWGAIDPLEGGSTSRYNISLDYTYGEGTDQEFMVQAYSTWYDFSLFSNFTFWLNDSVNGDMIEQVDRRNIIGINTRYAYRKVLSNSISYSKFGVGIRADNISDISLWHAPDRQKEEIRKDASVAQRNLFMWLEQDFIFSPKWKLQLGLRADYFTFNIDDRLANPYAPENDLPQASGYSQATILSPKLNLAFSASEKIDLYLNGGTGFHSNDARDVVVSENMKVIKKAMQMDGASQEDIMQAFINRNYDPSWIGIKTLPRAVGAEFGTRINSFRWLLLNASIWYLHLEEELVYVGDEGTTEISGPTRRFGLDIESRFQISSWLWADLDINLADAKYTDLPDGENYVPLAPRFTSQGGLTALHPQGWDGSIRYRFITDRPANEDNSVFADGYLILNLMAGYRFGQFRVFCLLENLLNSEWNEAQFDTESRLKYEAEPVSEIHFTPGNPINFQTGMSWEF